MTRRYNRRPRRVFPDLEDMPSLSPSADDENDENDGATAGKDKIKDETGNDEDTNADLQATDDAGR